MSQKSGNRTEKRIEAVYPVRLWGMDATGRPFIEAATTLNISRGGALVKNAPAKLSVGDILGLKSGDQKCRYQVIWVGKKGTLDSGYIGLKSLEESKVIWDAQGLSDPGDGIDTYSRPPQREHRLLSRLKCSLSAEVGSPASSVRARAFVTDINMAGCYIAMPSPCPPESKLTIALWLDERTKLWLDGIVISQHQGVGMGVKFLNLPRKSVDELAKLVETLLRAIPLNLEQVEQ